MFFLSQHYWHIGENRRCCLHQGPRSQSDGMSLDEYPKDHSMESQFHAEVRAMAEGLGYAGVDKLKSDREWREAFLDFDVYNQPIDGIVDVIDPKTLLAKLSSFKRWELLTLYIDTRFSYSIKKPPELKAGLKLLKNPNTRPTDIVDDPNTLLDDLLRRTVTTLMAIGGEMHNDDSSVLRSKTFFASVEDLREQSDKELLRRYKDGDDLTPQAFRDFFLTMEKHPNIRRDVILTDPDMLFVELENDRTPFSAALRTRIEDRDDIIFTPEDLEKMVQRWHAWGNKRQEALQQSTAQQREMAKEISERNRQPFAEKMVENFRNMSTSQKWMSIALATTYLYLRTSGKLNLRGFQDSKSNFLKFIGKTPARVEFVGLAVAGLYATGARNMVNNTIVGDGLGFVEGWANKGFGMARDAIGSTPSLSEDQLATYADFIDGIVGDEMKEQITVMSYMSSLPMKALTGSFTLTSDSKTGEFDVDRSSTLGLAVDKAFPDEYQADYVLRSIRKVRGPADNSLGDAFPDICFLLGAKENQEIYRKAELERKKGGYKNYDEVPVGSDLHDMYETLVLSGLGIAGNTDKPFYEVMGDIIKGVQGLGDEEWRKVEVPENQPKVDIQPCILASGAKGIRIRFERIPGDTTRYNHIIDRTYVIDSPGGTTRVHNIKNSIFMDFAPVAMKEVEPRLIHLDLGEEIVAIKFKIEIRRNIGDPSYVEKDIRYFTP